MRLILFIFLLNGVALALNPTTSETTDTPTAGQVCAFDLRKVGGRKARKWEEIVQYHKAFSDAELMRNKLEEGRKLAENLLQEEMISARIWGQSRYHMRVPSYDESDTLFLCMNYLKHQALESRSEEEKQKLRAEARVFQEVLVRGNLRLTIKVSQDNFQSQLSFDERKFAAEFALTRAVQGFDVSKGWRFSTYAAAAMRNEFLKVYAKKQKQISISGPAKVDDEGDFLSQRVTDTRTPAPQDKAMLDDANRVVGLAMENLSEREQQILKWRFGLNGEDQRTRDEIAVYYGVSPKRIEQLEKRSLQKLNLAIKEELGPD